MGPDGRPRVEPGLGRPRRRVRPSQHDARAPEGPRPPREPAMSACSSWIPRTRAASSRSAATPSSSRTARIEHLDALTRRYTRHPRFYGFVYPNDAAGPRDARHRPHPCPADHPRRDPRLTATRFDVDDHRRRSSIRHRCTRTTVSGPGRVTSAAPSPTASTSSRASRTRRHRSGPNRLRPPQPVEAWTGVRDALDVRAPSRRSRDARRRPRRRGPRLRPGDAGRGLPEPQRLDAGPGRRPACRSSSGSPAACSRSGSGASYDGSRFARDGVVCVTINYRVGVEGFLFLADGDANLRPARPGRRARVGPRQHRRLRWRPGERHDRGRVGRGDEHRHAALDAARRRAVPARDHAERRRATGSSTPRRRERIGRDLAAASARRRHRRTARRHRRRALGAAPRRVDGAQGRPRGPPGPGAVGPRCRREHAAVAARGRWRRRPRSADRPTSRPAPPATIDVIVGSNTDDWRLFRVLRTVTSTGSPTTSCAPRSPSTGFLARRGLRPARRDRARRLPRPGPRTRVPASSSPRSRPTGGAGSRPSASPRPTRPRAARWRRHLGVRVRLAVAAFGGPMGACHALEIPFVFDTLDLGPAQMLGGLLGRSRRRRWRPRCTARGSVRHDRRSGLAALRVRGPGAAAVRHAVHGRHRSVRGPARALGRRDLMAVASVAAGHRSRDRPPRFRRLDGIAQMYLALESPSTPMHFGALVVLDGGGVLDDDGAVAAGGAAGATLGAGAWASRSSGGSSIPRGRSPGRRCGSRIPTSGSSTTSWKRDCRQDRRTRRHSCGSWRR